jgi:cytochrome c oxidase subunit 2
MRRNSIKAVLLGAMASLGFTGTASAEDIGLSEPWQIGFQPEATEIMEQTVSMHNDFLLPLTIVIAVFVIVLLGYTLFRFRAGANPEPNRFSHNTFIEVVWTAVPTIIVAVIAVTSIKQIQFQDTPPTDPEVTLKAIGHQWFWEYDYVDEGINFEAMKIEDEDLQEGQPRLLSTDNHIVLPVDTVIRLLVTANPIDVIHAWTIPSFGVKVDAIPGRLNERWFKVKPGFEGRYYGQCSELCGARHAYMPITVDIVSKEEYQAWLLKAKEEFASLDRDGTVVASLAASDIAN